jgi:MoaA/NifB/PqqE/SkfB family radical SAM enzyme
MERNIEDLAAVARLTHELGGDTLHVSNLLPHTEEKRSEILYQQRLDNWTNRGEKILLPRMDADDRVWREYRELLRRFELHELTSNEFMKPRNSCPFIEKNSVSVRFDGKVSPCLPLLHTNANYLKTLSRESQATFFGSLDESSLLEVWEDSEYVAFRKKVMEFDFAPCTACASCELAESNQEDCFGSEPISCGGCLWAQGFVQCP